MAGFLIPFAQVLGTSMQNQRALGTAEQRAQGTRAGVDTILSGLGPDYEVFRQARKAGMPVTDLMNVIGGPVGEQLRATHQQERVQQIMSGPGTYQDKVQQMMAAGLMTPEKGFPLIKGDKATGSFEQYAQDVLKLPPDQLRNLPPAFTQQLYDKWLAGSVKPGVTVLTTRDEASGTNVQKAYERSPSGLREIPIGGADGGGGMGGIEKPYTQSEERGMGALSNARASADRVLETLQSSPTKKGALGSKVEAGKYYLGVGGERDQMITELGNAFQQLQLATISSGNVRAYQFIQSIMFHMPHVGDSDKLKIDKLKLFVQKGGFLDQADQILRYGSEPGATATGGGSMSGAAGGGESTEDLLRKAVK